MQQKNGLLLKLWKLKQGKRERCKTFSHQVPPVEHKCPYWSFSPCILGFAVYNSYFFLLFLSIFISWAHSIKKKKICLEKTGKKYSQLYSDGWNWDSGYFLLEEELEILCSVNGEKNLRTKRLGLQVRIPAGGHNFSVQ